jgi:hypothetical protein
LVFAVYQSTAAPPAIHMDSAWWREIAGIRHRHHGQESQEIRAESASPAEPLRCTSRLARNSRHAG